MVKPRYDWHSYRVRQSDIFQAAVQIFFRKDMISMVDAKKEEFEELELFDQTVLFTCVRVDRDTVPDDLYAYDLRDDCQGNICSVEPHVAVNHWGTVICKQPIEMNEQNYCRVTEDDYSYLGDSMTLNEFQNAGVSI